MTAYDERVSGKEQKTFTQSLRRTTVTHTPTFKKTSLQVSQRYSLLTFRERKKGDAKLQKGAPTPQLPTLKAYVQISLVAVKEPRCPGRTQHEFRNHTHTCFLSPGDAAIVQPLLSSHDDVESAAKVVWLHIHDLFCE